MQYLNIIDTAGNKHELMVTSVKEDGDWLILDTINGIIKFYKANVISVGILGGGE